jgi:lactoylglutathione lyase/methylmalonyl-CoA/ethylmalonyl-CoA epimerase
MKPMRIHHIGIVTPTREQAYALLELFGLEIDYTGYVEAYDSDIIFTKYNDRESPLELIIPLSGVLTRFNEGRGGLHHFAFEVDDVAAAQKEFEENGFGMLEKAPVTGTSDLIVNFLRPRYAWGILVEFVQTVGPIARDGKIRFKENIQEEEK